MNHHAPKPHFRLVQGYTMKELDLPELDNFIKATLDEDIGSGDITTNACVPESAVSSGVFIAKEPGVICGLGVLKKVFELLDLCRPLLNELIDLQMSLYAVEHYWRGKRFCDKVNRSQLETADL